MSYHVTRDGTRIPIRDLSTDHLRNIIAMIKRQAWQFAAANEYWDPTPIDMLPPVSNGEVAQAMLDEEYNAMFDDDYQPHSYSKQQLFDLYCQKVGLGYYVHELNYRECKH